MDFVGAFMLMERWIHKSRGDTMRLLHEAQPDALLVPQKSVQVTQGVSSVLVVGEDDSVALRVVTLGERFQDFFIVSQGLEAGQMVVVEGLQKAIPGRKVRPREKLIQPQAIGG